MRADDFLDDKPASSGLRADDFLDGGGGPQALPAGVRPSPVSGGRGLVNPPLASKLPPVKPMGALATAGAPTSTDPMGDTAMPYEAPQTLGESLMRPPGQSVPLSNAELADAATGETKAGRDQLEQRRLAGLADASRSTAPSAMPDPDADAKARQKEIKDAEPKNPFYQAGDTAVDVGRGVVKVLPHLAKNAWDAIRLGADQAGLDNVSRFAALSSQAGDETLKELDNPNGDHNMTGAIESLGVAVFGSAFGGSTGAIALGSGQSAADEYSQARNQGFGVADSTEAAVVYGVAEYLGERISIPSLGRMVMTNAIARGLKPSEALQEALKQQGGEQLTQAMQSLYDKFGSAGGKSGMGWDEYLQDVIDVSKQTAIMSGVAHGAGKVSGAMQKRAFDLGMAERAQQRAEFASLTPGVLASQARNTLDVGQQLSPTETIYQTDRATITTAPRAPLQLRDVPTTIMTPEQITAAAGMHRGAGVQPVAAPVEQVPTEPDANTSSAGRQVPAEPPVESVGDVSRTGDIGVAGVPQGALAAIAAGRVKGGTDGGLADNGMAVEPGAPLADAGRVLDRPNDLPPAPTVDGSVGVASGAPRPGAQAGGAPRAGSGGDAALTPKPVDAGSAAILAAAQDRADQKGTLDDHLGRLPPEQREPMRQVYAAAEREKPAFDATVQTIAKEIGAEAKLTALKKPGKAVSKVANDYEGDASRIKDVLRATINVNTLDEAEGAIASIFERFKVIDEPGTRPRNLLHDGVTPEDGYRDAKFNVLVNGHVAEIQVNVPEMVAAKDGSGHKVYDEKVKLLQGAQGRMLTAEESARKRALDAQMRAIYEPAWERAKATRSRKSASETVPPLRIADSARNALGGERSQAAQENSQPATLPIVTGTPSTSSSSASPNERGNEAASGAEAAAGSRFTAPSLPESGAEKAPAPVLQNRNRSDAAYVQQVSRIAANPDPDRLSFSRDFATGAPVVLADQVEGMVLGKKETITAATGRKIPVQYGVVDAHKLLPSNTSDGTVNKGYADGLPGRARVVAGNGRAAGLQAAYKLGTAVAYRKGIAADSSLHGIDAAAIEGMKKPVLVRIMQPEDVTANIGDESNQSGVADKSALERARDDARRLDLETLDFDDAGDLTPNTVRQFVDKMPESEQTALRNPDGSPTRQGQDRIMAAIFWQAYENEELVRLYAQATDPESKVVMAGLAAAAPQMMRLRDAGELDIRSLVAEAAGAAINAKRRGIKLADYAAQGDMATQPATRFVLQMFADNVRSARKIGETLRDAATFAHEEATKPASDMFGAVEKASRSDVLGKIHDTARSKSLEQPGGREAARDDVQRDGENAPGRENAGPAADDVRFARTQRADDNQGGLGFDEGTEALLASHSAADLKAKTDRESAALEGERKQKDIEQARLRKESEGKDAKKRADDTVDDFKLGQSAERQMSGMDDLFSRAGKGDKGGSVERVERMASQITAGWKNAPKVIVIATMADAPAGARAQNESQLAKGADGEPSAFFYNGSVYIVASQMGTSRDVATMLFHEALGHFGLRGAFGSNLDGVLTQMAVAREADVRAKATEYGLDYSDRTQRMHAAEEVLAELAQKQPTNTWVQKAIAAIRTWLRENVAAFRDLKLSDAEIVRNFIEPARDFVKMGARDAAEAQKPTFTPGVKADIPAFANDYKALEGRNVSVSVRVADTGKVATLAVDAAKELRELDEREAVFKKLMDCLA